MAALVPLLVLWFGIHMQAKIIVVFLFAIFPILINTYQGVRECDKNIIEVAHSFRALENADVAARAAALVGALHHGGHQAGDRTRPRRHDHRRVLHVDLRSRLPDHALHPMFEMDKAFVPVILLMILGVSMTAALNGSSGAPHPGAGPTPEQLARFSRR